MNRFWHWWYLAAAIAFIVLAAESVLHDMMMLAAVNGAMGLWCAWFAGRFAGMRGAMAAVNNALAVTNSVKQMLREMEAQLRDR